MNSATWGCGFAGSWDVGDGGNTRGVSRANVIHIIGARVRNYAMGEHTRE